MPFALVTIGLILVITGARDTYRDFGKAIVNDFTGPNNFTYWLLAIGSIGALGYIDALRGFSRGFMTLIILGMVLKNGGVFNQIQLALRQGPSAPQSAATPQSAIDNIPSGNSPSSSTATSNIFGTIASAAAKLLFF